MIKLKTLLDKSILNEDSNYRTPFQQGKSAGTDSELDQKQQDYLLSNIEQRYSKIKRARIDMSEFKNDVLDLLSIYKDKESGTNTTTDFINAFFELYPYSKTYTSWQGNFNDVRRGLNDLLRHAHAIERGDTSNYGYRFSKNLKENLFDKLGGTSDANRITGGQRDPRTGNMMVDPKNLKVSINRADYDTNISGIVSMNFQVSQLADKNTFHDIIDDIKQDIESKNDPTGAYDQTRLVSDIEFDCDLKVGSDTINFTATYEDDGDLKSIDIQDEAMATKHGITIEMIYHFLF
jgi:hypothetical protein